MKKIITLLLFAIGFVIMILISWMKFQTTENFQFTYTLVENQVEDPTLTKTNLMMVLRPFEP